MLPNVLDKEFVAVKTSKEEFTLLEERVSRWAQEERKRGNRQSNFPSFRCKEVHMSGERCPRCHRLKVVIGGNFPCLCPPTNKAELIKAVRKDRLVGVGSCSSIDECYEDEELWEVIREAKSPQEAVKLAREAEGIFLEQEANCRWGEDDDPQLENLRQWKENNNLF